MMIRRFLRHVFMKPADDGELGAGGGGTPAAEPITTGAPETVAAPAPSEQQAAAAAPAGPASMLDAINQVLQPRDEAGRFTFKEGQPNAATQTPPAAPAAPATTAPEAEPKPDDLLQMPEGMQPKAQERFQKLVDANRELTTNFQQMQGQFTELQTLFRDNGVQQEQFHEAINVIGMVNRGDFDGAIQYLMGQAQQIAALAGKPLPQMDALAQFPDLRQKVDGLVLSEADAMELARMRTVEGMRTQATQRQQQTQQAQQQEQQARQADEAVRNQGLQQIDAFCKQMQASDLDYSAIEAQLLPVLPQLMEGVPPQRWASMVKMQYDMLKKTAGQMRQNIGQQQPGTVLRATGMASPAAAPRNGYEAMWGSPRPA